MNALSKLQEILEMSIFISSGPFTPFYDPSFHFIKLFISARKAAIPFIHSQNPTWICLTPSSICSCQKNESSSFLALFSLGFLCFFKKRIALSAECVSVRQRCCVCARLLSSCSILCPGNCFQHSQTHRKYPPALLYRFLIRRQDNRWREREMKKGRGVARINKQINK